MAKKPIQVWIEEERKKRVEKILERNGLDMASTLRIFVAQIDLRGDIPLHFQSDREAPANSWQFPWTEEEIKEAVRESRDPKSIAASFENMDDAIDYLRKQ